MEQHNKSSIKELDPRELLKYQRDLEQLKTETPDNAILAHAIIIRAQRVATREIEERLWDHWREHD